MENFGFISYGNNYGNVQILNNHLTNLKNSTEGRDIGSALTELLHAIGKSKDLPPEKKQELLETIAALTEQASLEKAARQTGLIKSTWRFIRDSVSSVKDLLEVTERVRKLAGPFFGIDPL